MLLVAVSAGFVVADCEADEADEAGPLSADKREEIEQLVRDLGSDEFAKREAAERELQRLAPFAIDLLIRAARGKDLEVSTRAKSSTWAGSNST